MNRCYVYKGNSSNVVKRLLIDRGNWEETDYQSRCVNSVQFICKPVNFFEFVGFDYLFSNIRKSMNEL